MPADAPLIVHVNAVVVADVTVHEPESPMMTRLSVIVLLKPVPTMFTVEPVCVTEVIAGV